MDEVLMDLLAGSWEVLLEVLPVIGIFAVAAIVAVSLIKGINRFEKSALCKRLDAWWDRDRLARQQK
jgi:hypothetical protein